MSVISFPGLEEEILEYWEKENIFEKSLNKESPQGEFVFYEGPPTANGRPGIHHVLARAFKDLIPRYKTMRGFNVLRKAGWDTHGLPVELGVEKQLGISGKPDIESLKSDANESIRYFNSECRKSVWQYKEDWEKLTKRMGFWLDMENPYVTYENNYIESLWWILKQVNAKGLLYKGHKVVPHCPRCGTTLSSHEVAQGYRKVPDNSVYIKFKVKSGNTKVNAGDYILSWTTTPWTLPGNVALAVGDNIDYVKIKFSDSEKDLKEVLIMEKNFYNDRFKILLGDMAGLGSEVEYQRYTYELVSTFKGSDILGVEYEPFFPGAIPKSTENYANAYKVYAADFVTTEDGTGVVHTAVMYGEEDYQLGLEVGLPKQHTVSENGSFDFIKPESEILKELQGMPVKHKDKPTEEKTTTKIIDYLKKENILLKEEIHQHDYPFCWRCDTPLLYYAKDSWFIRMSKLRAELKVNNDKINWVPGHIKNGRFGEWLEGAKDWAISRERYWGTPLPVWECNKCDAVAVIGSREELMQKDSTIKEDIDLHRPYIDEVKFKCEKCDGEMIRDDSVLDCWFDSGAMPFAQLHYPFENKDLIDKQDWYPADYICEAIDQTRGWFYTLLAISTFLDKGTCYKNVICLGHINDKHGKKMSKSKGNIVDPWEVMNSFGVDALRFHLYTMNQPGEPKNFDSKSVEDVLKKNLLILWNVFSFYKMYVSSTNSKGLENASKNILDKWIIAKLIELHNNVTNGLEKYDITTSARKITEFINELSTWYVRRSRDRFKAGGEEQVAAVGTLGFVLLELAKIMAPFTPFIAEKLYLELIKDCPNKESEFKTSVHLESWSASPELAEEQKLILQKMDQVRTIVERALALRAEAKIKVRQPLSELMIIDRELDKELIEVIKSEVNVKEIILGQTEIKLNINITDELELEGIYRELVRTINALRKQAKLTINDFTDLFLEIKSDKAKMMMDKMEEDIKNVTLVKNINKTRKEVKFSKEINFTDGSVWIGIAG